MNTPKLINLFTKLNLFIYYVHTDNHYVPNLTIGPMVCKALRDHGVTADIDVHLMVQPVDQMIQVGNTEPNYFFAP